MGFLLPPHCGRSTIKYKYNKLTCLDVSSVIPLIRVPSLEVEDGLPGEGSEDSRLGSAVSVLSTTSLILTHHRGLDSADIDLYIFRIMYLLIKLSNQGLFIRKGHHLHIHVSRYPEL